MGHANFTYHVACWRFRALGELLHASAGDARAEPSRLSSRGVHFSFLGYGEKSNSTVLELTYNWGVAEYELGTAFGHIAIEVPDVYAACEKMRAAGGKIIREAGPMNAGTTIIAFLEDPDGYQIELIGAKS